jgi:hypothetical protein
MTVDLDVVRTWDVPACEFHVRRLFALADGLDGTYERLRGAETALAGWAGPASDAARPRVRLAASAASQLAGRVRQAAEAVRLGLGGLAEAVRLARSAAQSRQERAEAEAVARAVDLRIAAGLATSELPSPTRSLPPPGAFPADVATWWTCLPPDLRRRAITGWASEVGRLAGLPAAVRDAANRLLLARLLRLLRAERDAIRTDPEAVRRSVAVRAQLGIAEGVERQLASLDRDGTPGQLLTLDLTSAGRVAIAVGDVDAARHVAVLVPGMGQDATHGLRRTVEHAVRLRERAARESGDATAVVAWIGYAAPGLAHVPFAARARAGGRALADDLRAVAGSRLVDGGEPAHVTVVGHSYGSTVVGAAATAGPIAADDLVLLGSPGVLADRVDELGYRPEHVYVGEARFDPIADLGAFGADPSRLGATGIRAEPGPGLPWSERLSGGAHSHYFDPDSESLPNVARVAVGRGAEVTRAGLP